MSARFAPCALEGSAVRLEPLAPEHLAGLCEVGLDPAIWRWSPAAPITTRAQMQEYVEAALAQQAAGQALAFATRERASGRIVGSTRFHSFEPAQPRAEIGWTWIAPPWQRSAINTEAKYLMLRHAFERMGCVRVELKTDALNARSRAAILRIGARQEAILRHHVRCHDGRLRDSVYFAVLAAEWPAVKARLEGLLPARASAPTPAPG